MRKINSFADAERFAGAGIEAILSESLVAPDAAGILSDGDEPIQEASITAYVREGREISEHYVLDCRSSTGASYILCIHVGNGISIQQYDEEDWLSFRDECGDNGIELAGKPVLAYTFKGLVKVEDPAN
ncbi:hypothetical protein [Cohnella sp. JJ-181]|uniref:hypothetical protein n=1 Tax=Cohnella rhizoplanae TaxID=2974897 RepID=UPI0022FFA12C|nr:hypothetical protein [Cohnella sp. JJ-181]CAI6083735.1 hypothetical protein COHCIP112018_04097 [Cohnella sp. JJ-181]